MRILSFFNKIIPEKPWIREGAKSLFSLFFTLLPIEENKVVMDNFLGKGYGGDPKYIAEELRLRKGYDIVWLCSDLSEAFPDDIRAVKRHSLRAFYESATAKAWVFNTRNGRLTNKRNSQIYLQTWHGAIALKKVEKDAEERLSKQYIRRAKIDGRIADGILVDGVSNYKLFTQSFWLGPRCQLLKFGMPRTDYLLSEKDNEELKNRIRTSLGLGKDSYFVLYAPTFRDNGSIDNYISRFGRIQDAFESRYGETSIAVRLHPNIQHNDSYSEMLNDEAVIDVSSFPDSEELVVAADCLITDYSSIAYDFAVIGKPVFMVATDLNQYINDRGVYDIFYEQPFRLNTSMEMLIEEISTRNEDDYKAQLAVFYKKYPHFNDGRASVHAVDWLESKGMKQLKKKRE